MNDSRPTLSTDVCRLLGIEYPILQSGMGGIAGPALAAEVSNAGGLGILAGLLTPPDVLRAQIRHLRSLTDRPFGVNLLLLPEVRNPASTDELNDATVAAVQGVLQTIRERLGLEASLKRPPSIPALVETAVEVIIDEQVPVFSSGLGDPGCELTDRLHDAGIHTVVMVTNAGDARTVAANGADVIVAQGLEAGGHRSHFTKPHDGRLGDLGSLSLIPEVVDAVDVPVIAAGGIIDGRGLVAALALGASGVLMGSRFLVTRESTASEAYKKRLLEERGESTVVTDAISGRYARVVGNELTEAFRESGVEPFPFPSQLLATADIRAFADQTENADYLPLFAGQSIGRLNDLPWAADVVTDTIRQATQILLRQLNERVTVRA